MSKSGGNSGGKSGGNSGNSGNSRNSGNSKVSHSSSNGSNSKVSHNSGSTPPVAHASAGGAVQDYEISDALLLNGVGEPVDDGLEARERTVVGYGSTAKKTQETPTSNRNRVVGGVVPKKEEGMNEEPPTQKAFRNQR